MKDVHTERPKAGPIPIVSLVLHCAAMTVLVYLRSHFGFAFFRPKSLFFALAWAFAVFSIIARSEPWLWSFFFPTCAFGLGAIFLYYFHLVATMRRDAGGKGEHDHYSGRSHALRFIKGSGTERKERLLHLWGEPAALVLILIPIRLTGERLLSGWLFIGACSLALSEWLNWWFGVRRVKVEADSSEDAEGQAERLNKNTAVDPPKAVRKDPEWLPRNAAAAEQKARARRFASVLELREPVTLAEAEEKYKTLMAAHHPDRNASSADSTTRAAELNEAIEFFRAWVDRGQNR